ncbi:DUF6777 domain-containing protein [Streptomyces sp. H27-D2]|uniref:DUF6777 domain-containing protein n=1 Tax=Streptomyces sp. H27-D2 TaxID=3046304 RepID=UPI002DBABF8C|nr:DUF6777 domain-containing protein [Streptomyces sp. H27-D2]MEC4015404.1 DUF6777 domain-containing protein [Streptomyces sp. H27-D2]
MAATVLLTRPDGKSGSGEVFLQPASSEGRDPFTKSTAKNTGESAPESATPSAPSGGTEGTSTFRGSAPGLYGGSRNVTSCDVEKQIDYLRSDRAKAEAFADVEDIDAGAVPSYLRSLTPVELRTDARVTNHGFKGGKATGYQSVLQTGTAVLVDRRGVPRVRCACGNPLTSPVAVKEAPKTVGKPWPSYRSSDVVVVREATTVVNIFILVDPDTGQWFERRQGDTGGTDTPTTRPSGTPSGSPSSPSPGSSSPSAETSAPSAPSDTPTSEQPSPPPEIPPQPEPSGS